MSIFRGKRGGWVLRYYADGTKEGPRLRERLPAELTREQVEEIHRVRLTQRGQYVQRASQLDELRTRGDERTSILGGVAELWVAADLMAKGFHVFRHMIVQSPCDLIVMHGKVLLRVECKMRRLGPNERGLRPNPDRFDVAAFVDPRNSKISYSPEIWEALEVHRAARGIAPQGPVPLGNFRAKTASERAEKAQVPEGGARPGSALRAASAII